MAGKRLPNCQDQSLTSGLDVKDDMIDNSSSEAHQVVFFKLLYSELAKQLSGGQKMPDKTFTI